MIRETKKRVRRSKDVIDKQLMGAVCKVINEMGFSNLGINSVSEVANVEKAFIYRNYKSFDNFLERYYVRNDFWEKYIVQETCNNHSGDIKTMFSFYLTELYKTLEQNEEFESIIRWEVAEPTPYILRHARVREMNNRDFLSMNVETFKNKDLDIEALYALLTGGIYFLVMHKRNSTFFNVDFNLREGKKRITNVIRQLSDILFD